MCFKETVTDFISLGSQITADGDCSHDVKRCLLLGKRAINNLDSILKSRNITLSAEFHLVKAMCFFFFFPVVMHEYERWTIEKAVKVKVKVSRSCPALCNPVGYTVHGIH